MMKGTTARSKALLIKQMLIRGVGVHEIKKRTNLSLGYVGFIRICLNKNLPTNFHKKKIWSLDSEKRNRERKENYDKGAKYDYNSGADYSKREDKLILEFKGTDRQLGKMIYRSVNAIQIRRTRLKKDSGLILIVGNILESETQLQNV